MERAMRLTNCSALALVALATLLQPAYADVIADWNEKAVAYVLGQGLGPPPAERIVAMTHVAMFDAINKFAQARDQHGARDQRHASVDVIEGMTVSHQLAQNQRPPARSKNF